MVLVVAMLASMLVFAPVSGAATTALVEVENVVAFAGDTVSVDIVITTDSLIYGLQLAYTYDESKMTLDSASFASGGMGYKEQTGSGVDAVLDFNSQDS